MTRGMTTIQRLEYYGISHMVDAMKQATKHLDEKYPQGFTWVGDWYMMPFARRTREGTAWAREMVVEPGHTQVAQVSVTSKQEWKLNLWEISETIHGDLT